MLTKSCTSILRDTKRFLSEELKLGVIEKDDTIAVLFRGRLFKEILFLIFCEGRDRERVIEIIKGFEAELKKLDPVQRYELLREMLKIPEVMKVSIGLDNAGNLVIDYWGVATSKPSVRNIGAALLLMQKITGWLEEQFERVRTGYNVSSFSLEEGEEDNRDKPSTSAIYS